MEWFRLGCVTTKSVWFAGAYGLQQINENEQAKISPICQLLFFSRGFEIASYKWFQLLTTQYQHFPKFNKLRCNFLFCFTDGHFFTGKILKHSRSPLPNSLFSPIRMLLPIIDVSLRPHSGDYVQHTNPAISCNLTTNQKYTDRIHKMLIKRVAFQAPVHMRCSVSGPHGFCSVGQRISHAQILEGHKLTRGHISLKCWGQIHTGLDWTACCPFFCWHHWHHTGLTCCWSVSSPLPPNIRLFPKAEVVTLSDPTAAQKKTCGKKFVSTCLNLMSKRCFMSENIKFAFHVCILDWLKLQSHAFAGVMVSLFCVQPKRFRCANFICDTY